MMPLKVICDILKKYFKLKQLKIKKMNRKMFNFKWSFLFVAGFGLLLSTGCDPDEGPDEPILEDGIFVTGEATGYTGNDAKASFSTAKNEVCQSERASLYETYIALESGKAFQISVVAGGTETLWGPGTDFTSGTGGNDEPQTAFQYGDIAAGATSFEVPSNGLYHVAFDTEVAKAVIIPVNSLGIIGDAAAGWSDDVVFTASVFDTTTITYSGSNVELGPTGSFKFRMNNGWKVSIDTSDAVTCDNNGTPTNGLKLNTNFGATTNALASDLEPGGLNYSVGSDGIFQSGIYDVDLTWTAGTGWTSTFNRTADLIVDYSAVEFGFIGDGLDNMGNQHNWDDGSTLYNQAPTVDGDNLVWFYDDVVVNSIGGGFKIREGQDWSGHVLGFSNVALTGTWAGNFTGNDDDNFLPTNSGTGDFTLTISTITNEIGLNVDLQ